MANKGIEQYGIALRWIQAYMETNTSDTGVCLQVAQMYFKLKEYKPAVNMGRTFLMKPSTAESIAQRSEMYRVIVDSLVELKDNGKVLEWLKKWEEEFPGDQQRQLYAAEVLLELEMFEEALRYYRECHDTNFEVSAVCPAMISILLKLNRNKEALHLIEEQKRTCELTQEEIDELD